MDDAWMTRKYRNPPIVEALCEISFADSDWDATVPGRLFDEVKDSFPRLRKKSAGHVNVRISAEERSSAFRESEPWSVFATERGDRLVQLTKDLLVVNQLAPYPKFESWAPAVEEMVSRYRYVARPKSIRRLALRYINQVDLPGPELRMEEYFRVYPNLPQGLAEAHGPFLIRLEMSRGFHGHAMILTFGTAPAKDPAAIGFMLDLYDVCERPEGVAFDELADVLADAHDHVNRAFEGSITDTLRSRFGPEESLS